MVKPSCTGCRFMASQPDKWDYTLAGVPSPLTDELESQQLAKQVICCSTPLCHPVVQITVSSVTCCSTWLCYLQSAWSLAVAFVGTTCSQLGHLLQHFFVLFAVNCTFECIYMLQLLVQPPLLLCCLRATASLLVSVCCLALRTSAILC